MLAGPFQLTFNQVADAFEQFTGKKTEFEPVTTDRWMDGISKYINPEDRLSHGISPDDATTFTFRKSFGAW